MKLKGTALITGGSAGIGLAIAAELLRRGYSIVLVSRSPQKLRNAKYLLGKNLAKSDDRFITVHTADLSEPNSAKELFDWTKARKMQIDVLVNDAGMYLCEDLVNVPLETIDTMLTLNMRNLTMLCRLFGEDMAQRGSGRIINVSSYSVYLPLRGLSLYSGTKAYVKNFTLAFAREMRPKGVRVCCAAPAGVDTGLMGLSAGLTRAGRITGFLMRPRTCGRRIVRAAFLGRRYKIPGWYNRLWIPFLWLFRPIITKIIR